MSARDAASPATVCVERSGRFVVDEPEAAARLLFTPLGERAWAPGWDAEIVHPAHADDAIPPEGTVFTTRVGPRPRLWVLVRAGGAPCTYDYVNVAHEALVTEVRVVLEPIDATRTGVFVRYRWTALSDAAALELAANDDAAFAAMLDAWSAAIRARPR